MAQYDPHDKEAYLQHIRENPEGALRYVLFDLASPIASSQSAAKYLSESLQNYEADAFSDIETIRQLADLLVRYTDEIRFIHETAVHLIQTQKNP